MNGETESVPARSPYSSPHKIAVRGVPRSGKPEELIEAFGIGAATIAERVRVVAGMVKS